MKRSEANLRLSAGDRKVGDQVNLERALAAHVRFGGHFVQVETTPTLPHLVDLMDLFLYDRRAILTTPLPSSLAQKMATPSASSSKFANPRPQDRP